VIAGRRYQAFASAAEAEAQPEAAAVFRHMSARRKSNAEAHLRLLDTLEDASEHHEAGVAIARLKVSIARSFHEYAVLYPGMARTARDEGLDDIAQWFDMIAEARRVRAHRFEQALDQAAQSHSVGFGT
jgi:rubrerythrin